LLNKERTLTEIAENLDLTREEILSATLKGREQEIMHYQLNIDNYTLALEEIRALPTAEAAELAGFADQIANLLASEKLEQKKSKIMLRVIQRQLE
jgi:hypothetical protein